MSTDLVSVFTEAEAREFTEELKSDYGALQTKISTAWKGRIWVALGHESWQDYLDVEFKDISLRPPKELEDQVLTELRAAGMSTRGIASATDMSHPTVFRRLRDATVSDETVVDEGNATETVIGLDGRSRPASISKPPQSPGSENIVDAEVIEDDDYDLDDRPMTDLGLEPATINLDDPGTGLGREHVIRAIHDLHFGAAAPLPMVKKKSKLLETAFAGGMGDLDSLDGDGIHDLSRDVADAAAVLSDLLSAIANQRAKTFAGALADPDTRGSMNKTIKNLQVITGDRRNP